MLFDIRVFRATTWKQNPYVRHSEPPGNLSQNNRINFNLYVVTLWIDGERGFCPSAPLGVTFVGCDKSNQKHAFLRERADPKQLCFAELVSGPTSSFAAIKALLNPTKETVWAGAFPFCLRYITVCACSLEKIYILSFLQKAATWKVVAICFKSVN